MTDKTDKIIQLLEEKKYNSISKEMKEINPADAALVLQELPEHDMPPVFRLLPKELAADTFAYMDSDARAVLIKGFSDRELEDVMQQLFLDDTVDMIEEMPANVVKRVLRHVDSDTRKMINQMLNYPRDSAGSIMTMEYVDLKRSMTVDQAFQRIRATGTDKETVYTCYVTDERRKLEGIVTVKDLLFAQGDRQMKDIMETNVICVNTHTDQELVAAELGKYDFLAIPVVDKEERLVGIVTIDDALDVIQEEATEDIQKMAAISPSDKPYMKMSVLSIWKQRAPWLLLLMISATFTSAIISSFEDALAASIILTSFIPMLMDTGGNAGSQTSITIIRGISLGEIRFRDTFRILGKEVSVALLCGLTLASANFIKLMLFDKVGVTVALVICITLFLTVLVANVLGTTLPVLAKKVGFDPAVMASPLITTIVDAVALLIYFSIAKMLLGL